MVTRKQLAAVALLVATFAVGAIAGRASSRWGGQDRRLRTERQDSRSRPNDRGPNSGNRGFVSTLQKELNLTPVQKDSVQAILKRYDPKMRSVWDGMKPTFDSLRAQVHAEIQQVLTDDQKAAFQKWTAKMDSVAKKRSKEAERAR